MNQVYIVHQLRIYDPADRNKMSISFISQQMYKHTASLSYFP